MDLCRTAVVFFLALGLTACNGGQTTDQDVDVAGALQGDSVAGFARAIEPRAFVFPRDHGPHRAFRNEWWYLTGNLESSDGRPFGFQATFFRIALQPAPVTGASRWRARDIYMVHVALTDVKGEHFFASQRLSRAALGLAGATTDPFHIWLEDWSVSGGNDNSLPWRLQVADEDFALALNFEKASMPVLQGDSGLSRKSAKPGNASYYYSLPRLATEGTVTVGGERYLVRGLSWLDREWSTSALGENQVGWDWFALQLEDGTDLMYYRLRQTGGETDPHSQGTLVSAAGKRRLGPKGVVLQPTRYWESPRGGRYPVAWWLEIPGAGLRLRIEPRLENQEQHGIVRYWEGAVVAEGTYNGRRISGSGYAELTGYSPLRRRRR